MVATRLLFAAFALQQATANPVGERGTAHRRSTTKAIQSYARYNGSLPVGYELDLDLQNTSRCDIDFCAGTINSRNNAYVYGDARLGPVILPSCLSLTALIESSTTYSRFGGLCPGEFLSTWTNYAPTGKVGWFFYSFADGFANNTAGSPIRGRMTLKPGVKVDRFGSVRGNFVAPAGSPYDQRALPPANMDYDSKDASQVPYNYHVYEVEKAVVVVGGPVAPWFGQPGLGMQFQLPKSVGALIEDGVLSEVIVEEKCSVKGAA